MNPVHMENAHRGHWLESEASKEYGAHQKEVTRKWEIQKEEITS